MYKNYKSNFNVLVEEFTSKWQTGGVLSGEFCVLRKDAVNNIKIKDRGSQYIDKLKQIAASQLPLKISAIKSERPETSNSIAGQGDLMTAIWVDVVQEYAPGLFSEPMSLPLECIDVVTPDGNNWSPKFPKDWTREDNSIIKPKRVSVKDKELQKQTSGNHPERNLIMKHINNALGKEAQDGRSQIIKATESVEKLTDVEQITEAYNKMYSDKKNKKAKPKTKKSSIGRNIQDEYYAADKPNKTGGRNSRFPE